ncbi:MAG: AMIN domain-containing protein [Desulfovibrio sp.]|jgi:hypothetical protein|nr:AMIN domain-containing protein [Desulfovibrio sp.]
MNKSLLALLLGVCFMGMCLLMYQETRESSRPAKPAHADAAADRGAGFLSPGPQDLSAVPVLPQAGQPVMPARAGRSAGMPPRTDFPLTDKIPVAPRPEKESGGVKTGETKPVEEKNSGGEKAPVVEKAPALPTEVRPSSGTPSPTEQAAPHAPAVQALPDALATSPGQSVRAAKTPPRPDAAKVAKLVVFARDTGATVRLTSGKPMRYQTMNLTGPDRVVVDVEGLAGLKAPGVPKNSMVTNVRLGAIAGKTRIVIDLTAKPGNTRFVLSKEKDMLDIRIDQ